MTTETVTTETGGIEGSVSRELSKAIARLVANAESGPVFIKQACAEIVRAFRSPYAAVSVRLGSTIVEDYWHTGSTDPRFWKKPIDEMLNESLRNARPMARQFSSRDARFRIGLVSVILRDLGGSMIGVLSIVTRIDEEHQGPAQREVLEAVATQLSLGLFTIERGGQAKSGDAPSTELSKAAGYRSGVELAFALASSLRNKYGCDQAAVGFARGSRARVISVSGLDEISERSEAVRIMADAMGEAIDRGGVVACQRSEQCGYRVHKRWHDTAGGVPVATVPVEAGEGSTLVVALRRAGDMPFRKDELEEIGKTVGPYAPAFEMLERASRSVASHAIAKTRARASGLVRPGGWGVKAMVAVAVLAAGWVAFGTMGHSVSATAALSPAQQRHIAAPYAGRLAAVLVAPGDDVAERQVLARFDTDALEVERAQLLAEISIAQLNEDRAIAESASAEAAMARAEQSRARARLSDVEQRLEAATIRAPFAGRVLRGDLRQRVGETVPIGEALFEIADTSEWTIEIEMPQHGAGDTRAGLTGHFATNARPEEASAFSIDRVSPVAEIRQGRSVYVAEATVTGSSPWMKSGMEGLARVDLGRKPVWWMASHRFVDYLRMNFWL